MANSIWARILPQLHSNEDTGRGGGDWPGGRYQKVDLCIDNHSRRMRSGLDFFHDYTQMGVLDVAEAIGHEDWTERRIGCQRAAPESQKCCLRKRMTQNTPVERHTIIERLGESASQDVEHRRAFMVIAA
jgi:hypothetical protein